MKERIRKEKKKARKDAKEASNLNIVGNKNVINNKF
jgi:hypothetical protein